MTPYMPVAELALPVSARDHVKGPENAPVTLVEYGGFRVPLLWRGTSGPPGGGAPHGR